MGRYNAADNKHLTQRLKMKSIARLLLWVFPFFGIIYILGWRKVLERDGVFVGEYFEESSSCFINCLRHLDGNFSKAYIF
jgi:hypothetical protein